MREVLTRALRPRRQGVDLTESDDTTRTQSKEAFGGVLTSNGWTFVFLAFASFALGVWLDYRELIIVGFGFLLNLVFAAAWLGFRPRIEVKREISPVRVSEGEGAAGVLTVTNAGHRRCPPILAVESVAGEEISVPLPGLAPDATYKRSYLLPTSRRGCYAVGPLWIGHTDPLRLISVTQSHGAETTLWVHPRVHKVSPVPTGHSQELEGPTSAGAPRGGIVFHSLREYIPGDDLRLVHWRSTARTGTLMVRHTVITNEPKILVVLDTRAGSYEGEAFEDAVRVAASLVVACADHRFPTELRTTGGINGSIDPNGRGWSNVLDKLAAVRPSAQDPGLPSLVRMAARRDQGVSLAVVTGQPDMEYATAVGRVRSRFQAATFVQVGERFDRSPMTISGVLTMNASTSEDFARKWKARLG